MARKRQHSRESGNRYEVDPLDPATMRLIITRRNGRQYVVLFSAADFDLIKSRQWRIRDKRREGIADGTEVGTGDYNYPGNQYQTMARFLLDPAGRSHANLAHYRNLDRLDNRRQNLVVATPTELPKPSGHGVTGERYVYRVNGKQNRSAPYQVVVQGRHVSYTSSLSSAIELRDEWLRADC